MRDRKVATRYAGALLASAKGEGMLAQIAESFAGVIEVVDENADLVIFLNSPQVAEQEKRDLLKKVFGPHVEPIVLRFLHLLIDKNRIENLLDIGEEFAAQVEKDQGVVRAAVVTAVALPDDLAALLKVKLAKLTGATIILEKKVDSRAIGGVKVTMGDRIFDGTVRANLDRLRKKLEKAPVR